MTPPGGSRPTLVVDTRPNIDEAAIAELRADLHGYACPNGILFDDRRCLILRDTFDSLDESSIIVEKQLSTSDVLGRLGAVDEGRPLEVRVERWLEMLSASWDQALSLEPEVSGPFLSDIVGAAAGSTVHAIEHAAR